MVPALIFAASVAASAPSTAGLEAVLRSKDQALMDAFAPGDRAVWDKALSADAVYVDENGVIMERAAFLEQLLPLPSGASGDIAIETYELKRHGDTAIVIHKDAETENYHGQILHDEFLMSEVWRKEGGAWKLALAHAYSVNKDPPAIAAPMETLRSYVGRYRAGPDFVYVIALQGDGLIGGVEGHASHPVKVEAPDVLFVQDQPRSRKIFQRDASGKVVGFLDRREGVDVVWKRITE